MNIAEKLADTVKSRGVQLAYGEPVVAEGMTVIPVSLVGYGFGGGGPDESIGGGVGGGVSLPVGVYQLAEGTVRFVPNMVALVAVSAPVVLAAGYGLSRILRALR
jgi:uncharacterized spore protein YtfJ